MAESLSCSTVSKYTCYSSTCRWTVAKSQIVSWENWMPILSWITGWINCSGWVALVATGGLLGSELIVGVISLMHKVKKGSEFPDFRL